MAKVSSALREKKRYIVFEIVGNAGCSDAVTQTQESFTRLFGTLDAAKAGIKTIKATKNRCMISTNRKYVDKSKAALIMVKSIKNSAVILRSIGVSGSVKGATTKYLGA